MNEIAHFTLGSLGMAVHCAQKITPPKALRQVRRGRIASDYMGNIFYLYVKCFFNCFYFRGNNDGNMTVCQSNGPERYARYLQIVEELRAELKLDTLPFSKTEELIFSCSD